MTNKNDSLILTLKEKIAFKKAALATSEKFIPITNCNLFIDGVSYNLHTLDKSNTLILLVKLKAIYDAAKSIGLESELEFGGFSAEDWISDLKSRWSVLNRKAEEAKLKEYEQKLHKLLSTDKQVELELKDIAASLEL